MGANISRRGSAVAVALLVCCVAWLCGCGGHGAGIATGDGNTVTAVAPDAADFTLPAPAQILDGLPRTASGAIVLRDGSDALAGYTQLAITEDTSLRLQPDWQPGGNFEQVAYGVYSFNLLGYAGQPALRLSWDEQPQDYGLLWVGLANWDKARWDWYHGPEGNAALDIGAHTYGDYTAPASGAVLVAVVLLGDTQPLLQRVRLGDTAAPWPVPGHDVQHTGRSPHTGPATNALKWKFRSQLGSYPVRSVACAADGTLYASAEQGVLAFNPDGTQKWMFAENLWSMYPTQLAVDASGVVYATGSNIFTAHFPDGTLKWSLDLWDYTGNPTPDATSPTVGGTGDIYIGAQNAMTQLVLAVHGDGTVAWTYDIEGPYIVHAPVCGPDGTVYASALGERVYAINADGSLKWTFDAADTVYPSPLPSPSGEVYIMDTQGTVYARNPDGTIDWTYAADGPINASPVLGSDGAVYFCTADSDNRLYCLEATGDLRWRSESYPGLGTTQRRPVLGPDGTVYVVCDQGLLAFDDAGNSRWNYDQPGEDLCPPCFGPAGEIYTGTKSSCDVVALEPDGSEHLRSTTGCPFGLAPVIAYDGTVYAANVSWTNGVQDSCLYAIDTNGNLLWSDWDYQGYQHATLDSDGGLCVVSDFGNRLTAHDSHGNELWSTVLTASTGNTVTPAIPRADGGWAYYLGNTFFSLAADGAVAWQWIHTGTTQFYPTNLALAPDDSLYSARFALDADGALVEAYTAQRAQTGIAIADDGTLYLCGNSSKVLALAPDGTQLGSYNLPGYVQAPPALGADGTVYVGVSSAIDETGALCALTPGLALAWSYPTASNVYAPLAVDADGTVYFGSGNDLLSVAAGGTLKWQYTTDAKVDSAPAIAADGTVVFGSDDGFLYAVGPGEG